MNKKNGNKIFRLILACVAVCFILSLVPINAEAASAKNKALNAYKKFLSQETIEWNNTSINVILADCQFAIVYIDNNSVPELVVYVGSNDVGYSGDYALYTYKNNKVTYASKINSEFSYYKKKGVFTASNYTGETSYYKVSNGKVKYWLEKVDEKILGWDWDENGKTNISYWKEGNNSKGNYISKASFNKLLKNATGSKKAMTPKFRDNTTANRSKYLK